RVPVKGSGANFGFAQRMARFPGFLTSTFCACARDATREHKHTPSPCLLPRAKLKILIRSLAWSRRTQRCAINRLSNQERISGKRWCSTWDRRTQPLTECCDSCSNSMVKSLPRRRRTSVSCIAVMKKSQRTCSTISLFLTPTASITSPPWPTMSLTPWRSEEHTSELQSRFDIVCRLLLEKKKKNKIKIY